MKVAMLQGYEYTREIFSEEVISELRKIVDLFVNTDIGEPKREMIERQISDADIIVTSWKFPRLDEDIIAKAAGLKLIVHAAGSVKSVVSQAVWQNGIRVVSCAEPLSIGVAETTLGLTLVSLKGIFSLSESTSKGDWPNDRTSIRNMYNITIGVIGAGRVGRNYMKLLKSFKVRILVYDPTLNSKEIEGLGAEKVDLDDLMELSDVVSIHAPSIPATARMINKSNLRLMKDGAILINTARGSLVDEDDLIEELRTGRISACLDVTDPEPPAVDHPFRKFRNVILTPHIAGLKNEGRFRIGEYALDEIKRYLRGEEMDGEVTLDELALLA